MKKLILAFSILAINSAIACDFQGEKKAFVDASDVICNPESKTATIKSPKIAIEDKIYNFGAGYAQKQEYWETDTSVSGYETSYREVTTVTTEREKKTKKVGVFLTQSSLDRICQLFGFSSSKEAKYSNIYSYFKKAYWLEDGKLYQQSPNYFPLEEINCK